MTKFGHGDWPTRDELRQMSPAEVNLFLAHVGSPLRVAEPDDPIETDLQAANGELSECRRQNGELRDGPSNVRRCGNPRCICMVPRRADPEHRRSER